MASARRLTHRFEVQAGETGTALIIKVTSAARSLANISLSVRHCLRTTVALAAAMVLFGNNNLNAQTVLSVASGGTGATSFTTNTILTGNGSSPINSTSWSIGGGGLYTPNGAVIVDDGAGDLILATANAGAEITMVEGSNGGISLYPKGNGAVGIAGTGSIALGVGGSLTSSTAYGLLLNPTFGSGATYVTGFVDALLIAPSQTVNTVIGSAFFDPVLGSGSTVGTVYAIDIAPLTSGTTNYAFYSGGAGLVHIGDSTPSTSPSAGAVVVNNNSSLGGDGSAHFARAISLGSSAWKGTPTAYNSANPTPGYYAQNDQDDARMELLASGGKHPVLSGHILGGTLASPAATPQNADFLIRMEVFDGTNYLDNAATIDLHQDGSLASGSHATSIRFNTTNSSGTAQEVMRLDHDGLVYAQEVLVTPQSAWPDYVFSTGYRLAPLSEVERVIKTEQHLPGIPSATEVAAHGVKTGEMEAKLIAKVEELTLHLIDQEKRLASQQTSLVSQQAEMANQEMRITQLERENSALRRKNALSAPSP